MYTQLRPFLFYFDPEKIHYASLSLLEWLPKRCFKLPENKPLSVMGLNFSHPVGLAAGLDKNARYINALSKLGFSFIEVGTVTPRPQKGNPKPRLFRVPSAGAIINRMGFNNDGVDALVIQVKKSNYKGILGINIGKNTNTDLNDAAEDYLYCLRAVYPYASYITINISSPNSPNLRLLQQENYFKNLLTQLVNEKNRLTEQYHRKIPLVIKLSPDESENTLKKMGEIILKKGIEGVIATNTTCNPTRSFRSLPFGGETGGVSGKPLTERSTNCIKILKEVVGNEVAIIGSGGIDSSDSANNKIKAGASLLQLYTGLIYKGPSLISHIVDSLNSYNNLNS